ncbi:hypothetical protein VHEMI04614 [[Torrubiella] hemipterigena]|uniref:Altered inheritance of mitochondria protein 41 n=1 Tax=[Torrubiella] hemipterigena TaxID=1531966 RepID=A0A0A1TGS5_9HYPO|nr:hypothetical protein VHEMI04614 [[Torrubiella] hemipterigena]
MAAARFIPQTLRLATCTPRFATRQLLAVRKYSDDAAAIPPLLAKLKGDLKTAMRAKDAPRLAVLRAVMAANLNASKTASPIRTDVQLVALMRSIQKGHEESAAEAKTAGREDLVEKETLQIGVLESYLADSGVQTLGEAEIKAAVEEAIKGASDAGVAGKALVGDVMKRLKSVFDGKDVDRKAVANLVKELTS